MPVVDARASSLSTFSIPVVPYELLGTPGNLELRKREGMNGLNISNANLAGLMSLRRGTDLALLNVAFER